MKNAKLPLTVDYLLWYKKAMRERYGLGLIETLLGKVMRIETEPREAALNRHLLRLAELGKQRQALKRQLLMVTTTDPAAEKEARIRALHGIEDERLHLLVNPRTPVHELVIFNSRRLAL